MDRAQLEIPNLISFTDLEMYLKLSEDCIYPNKKSKYNVFMKNTSWLQSYVRKIMIS